MNYLLIPITALLLVTGQSFWNKSMKLNDIFSGSLLDVAKRILSSPDIWIGGTLYLLATIFYLLSLSKNNFFIVQSTMTGLALILSTIVASIFFNEKILPINIVGIIIIFIGASMVAQK